MSSEQVKELAANANRNTDDLPLLEFHAPRQLFDETRDLNVELLYQHKGGLVPPGTEIPDPETTYLAMIDPLLEIGRSNLANQAMAMLSQVERRDPSTLHVAIAKLNLDSGNLKAAEEALVKASEAQKPEGGLYAETQELWGLLRERTGERPTAITHFANAANADGNRTVSMKKLAELHASDQSWINAATWMERYIQTMPRDVGHSWAALGDYRMAAEQPDEALKALKTSVQIDQYTYWARYRMARLFTDQKQTEDAIRQYEFILKYAYDRDADVYIQLANIYKEGNRMADARRVLEKGKRIFPTNADIYRLYKDVSE
jgi:tetratricopeptide (TPR) repeat protein